MKEVHYALIVGSALILGTLAIYCGVLYVAVKIVKAAL